MLCVLAVWLWNDSFLVVHGADINAVDSDGMTPLDWADSTERPDVAESAHLLLAFIRV